MEEVTPVKVTHSIPLFWGSVEVLELHQDCVYEWRYLDDKGKLLYRSSFMYGNPPSALRDALITITGEPSDVRLRQIDKIRAEINKKVKIGR